MTTQHKTRDYIYGADDLAGFYVEKMRAKLLRDTVGSRKAGATLQSLHLDGLLQLLEEEKTRLNARRSRYLASRAA